MKSPYGRRRLSAEHLEKRNLLATIAWTAAGNPHDWNLGANGQTGQAPGQFDTALFDNTAASSIPGEVTNFTTVNRTIGGLS